MASPPNKRPKPYSTSPNFKTLYKTPSTSKSSSLSSSHSSSIKSFMEPSPYIFPSKSEFLRLVAVIAIASSVAITCNFFVTILHRQPKPFCDSIIDFEDSISDICEPCPRNGECYQGKLECVRGYKKHGNLCIEDGDINEKAKKLSEMVETCVCQAYAHFLCDGSGKIWAREDEIWGDLDEHKLMEIFGMDSSIYMHTKLRAMEASDRLLETRTNFEGIKELKCPDLLAEQYKPFKCQIQQWISKHALVLVPVFALLVGCTLLFRKIHRRRHLSIRAEELYHQVLVEWQFCRLLCGLQLKLSHVLPWGLGSVKTGIYLLSLREGICEILEEHALMSKSVNGETEPWIVVSWLRDHLLLPRERKDPALWKKVEKLVQEDSRLDWYPKLVKGESKVVWEWQVEGSLSSSRMRKKGGVSDMKPNQRAANVKKQWPEVKSGGVLHC